MLTMSSEIPYFGEHTQITLRCESCGWKHTDFIPSEGEKMGHWSLLIKSQEMMSARVVRSSSCTIRIPDLDLEVSPGSSSSGFVTNVEGVINRFVDAIAIILHTEGASGNSKDFANAKQIIEGLSRLKIGLEQMEIEILDPRGRSQIIHKQATSRDLTETELENLDVGSEFPIFESS
jgi:zinc finger protein